MRRTLLTAITIAATLALSSAAPAQSIDVRTTATWSATIAPHGVAFTGTALCDGFLPSDLEAWDLQTGDRLGDDELHYVAGVLPGFGLVLSGYDRAIDVRGWCG